MALSSYLGMPDDLRYDERVAEPLRLRPQSHFDASRDIYDASPGAGSFDAALAAMRRCR